MKNLLIGLLIIGLTNLSYSQNSFRELETTKDLRIKQSISTELKSVSLLNAPYLEKVQNDVKPSNIMQLELMAFKYNIKKLINPINRPQLLVVKFSWSTNWLIAKYDHNGKILSTHEEFKDFKLPNHILKSISLNHPNWSITTNTYKVSYNSISGVKMGYIVVIRKGNQKKKIHFDSNTKYPTKASVITNNNLK
ncbi:hypothetical protein JBL43_06705 [Aureibaculum sp. A20]|uniref:Nicotinate-nucleotide adenylyltransferase n=1 Tax=Aureibaculum flavum TaxID=2795986 RepID=A0ABS0WPK9_9FLAO|nr:hypothetical protein [Aureibaculum flavum]MBJ2173921.1 hypothetical protein [Aureibaculum flavum]